MTDLNESNNSIIKSTELISDEKPYQTKQPASSSASSPSKSTAANRTSNNNSDLLTKSLVDSSGTDADGIGDLLVIETACSPRVLEYLIRYMYSGYLDTLDAYAKDIYEISREFKVHGLTNLAREHLAKDLNIQNCCDYLVFGVVNNDYELNSRVHAFIGDHYETIVKTSAYKQAKRKYRELFENTFNEIAAKRAPSCGGGGGAAGCGGGSGGVGGSSGSTNKQLNVAGGGSGGGGNCASGGGGSSSSGNGGGNLHF
jgi:hypothetical protein